MKKRLLFLFLVVTLILAIPMCVSAVSKDVDVASESEIDSAINSASSGDVLNVTLKNDIEITNKISLSKKITVNLYFNGKQINYTGATSHDMDKAGFYITDSAAVLNLYGSHKLNNYSDYTHYDSSIAPDMTGTGNLIVIQNGTVNLYDIYMLSSVNAFVLVGDMVDNNDYYVNIYDSVLRAPEGSSKSAMVHEGGNSSNNALINRTVVANNSVLYGGFKGINYAYNLTVGTSFTNVKFYDFYIKNDCWYAPDNANISSLLMNSYEKSANYTRCIFNNYDETVGDITIYTETGKQNFKLIDCTFGKIVSGGKFSGDKGGNAIIYIIDKMPACNEAGTMKVCTNGGELTDATITKGEHVFGTPVLSSFPNGFASNGIYMHTCTICGASETAGESGPIFYNLGFSLNQEKTDAAKATKIDTDLLNEYLLANPNENFDYGVLAGDSDSSLDIIDGKLSIKNGVLASFKDTDFSYVRIKLIGISNELKAKEFALEFYIFDGTRIDYTDGEFNYISIEALEIALDEVRNKALALLETKRKLYYNDDGSFRVMIVADVHMNGNDSADYQARIRDMVEKTDPNLVIFTGDNTVGAGSEASLRTRLDFMVGYIEEQQIPWCHVFGNHDREGGMSNTAQQAVYESYEYCVSKAGPDSVNGVGNYVLGIYNKDDSIGSVIYLMDSGTSNSTYSYDYIQDSQIAWYKESSELLQEYNDGEVVPAIMAFHIPLLENNYAYNNRDNTDIVYEYTGNRNEPICPSTYDTDLLETILTRGDVKAIVTGHDHNNDYMYNYYGIKLCSAPTISPLGYGSIEHMGCRVFDLSLSTYDKMPTYVEYVIERLNPDDFEQLPVNSVLIDGNSKVDGVASGLDNNNIAGTATITQIDTNGVGGSGAIEIKRSQTGNFEFYIDLSEENYGKLGDNKYLIVWADFTNVDFRKACFGLITNNSTGTPYRTDDYDRASPVFYYMADGTSEWVEMKHGDDGCFGSAQNSSMLGYKGYFALPVQDLLQGSAKLNADSLITGVYMYADIKDSSYANVPFYLDNIMLTQDYKTANLPTK
ncbi:MAG: metallophosphoesterase [Clostridia bacterium]|nr:metallophosphoesterase [Clostridia bacterium]